MTLPGARGCFRRKRPYDAVLEYLEAPVVDGDAPYIDTGVPATDGAGIAVRFAALRTVDSTLFGASSANGSKWYAGANNANSASELRMYLAWNAVPTSASRPSFELGAQHEVLLNYMNNRSKVLRRVGGTTPYTEAIADNFEGDTLPSVYLFHFHDGASSYQDGRPRNRSGALVYLGNYRVYRATVTVGGAVERDFIPVRRGLRGFMYDRVTRRLFGSLSPVAFTCGPDAAGQIVKGGPTW